MTFISFAHFFTQGPSLDDKGEKEKKTKMISFFFFFFFVYLLLLFSPSLSLCRQDSIEVQASLNCEKINLLLLLHLSWRSRLVHHVCMCTYVGTSRRKNEEG